MCNNFVVSDFPQSELPHTEEVFDTVCQKVSALQQLHKNADIPALSEIQSQLNFRFAQATELADLLQGRLEEFKVERDAIESDIDDAVSWVAGVRERLVTLDDMSGQDDAIVSRLQVTQVIDGCRDISVVAADCQFTLSGHIDTFSRQAKNFFLSHIQPTL